MGDTRKPKRKHNFAVNAFRVVQKATGQVEPKPEIFEGKNPHAVALGRMGGLKGGKARLEKMTPEQRQEIARKAAQKGGQANNENPYWSLSGLKNSSNVVLFNCGLPSARILKVKY